MKSPRPLTENTDDNTPENNTIIAPLSYCNQLHNTLL